MPLINVPDIQNLDAATPELWNSRYATIVDLLNGSLDDTNLAANAVTAPKLAANSVITTKILDEAVTPPKWTNPYKFKAQAAATQNISSSTWTTVTLGTELFDTNGNFSSNTYTAPVDGFYHFDGSVVATSAGLITGMGCRFLKNGTTDVSGSSYVYDNNTSWDGYVAHCSDTIELAAGDTIVLQTWMVQSSGTHTIASGTGTRLAGFLVSET